MDEETYRYIEENGIRYVQVRGRRGWGRKVRAQPLAGGGFTTAFRNLVRDRLIPTPSGYRWNAASGRLVSYRSTGNLRRAAPITELETGSYRERRRQVELEYFTAVSADNERNYADAIVVNGRRYVKSRLQGQWLVYVNVDIRRLKKFFRRRQWITVREEDGVELTDEWQQMTREMAYFEYKRLENARSHWETQPVVFRLKLTGVNVVGNSINFATALVNDDPVVGSEPLLISPYIEYDFLKEGVGKVYKNLGDRYMPGMCFFSCLINIFDNDHNKKKRNTGLLKLMSYEALVEFIYTGTRTLKQVQKRGVCFEEIRVFFEKFRIAVSILDACGQVRLSYEPETKNQSIRPNSVYFMLHDRHLYWLNAVDSLCQSSKAVSYNVHGLSLEGSYFPVVMQRKAEEDDLKILSGYDEVAEMVQSDGEAETRRDCIVPGEVLKNLPYFLLKKFNLQPHVVLKGMYHLSKVCLKKTVFRSIESDTSGPLGFRGCAEDLKYFMEKYAGLKKNLLLREAQSVYNGGVRTLLTGYKPGAVSCAFREITYRKASTLWDFRKFHTWLLMGLEKLMSFNGFDSLVEYDGSVIEPYTMYLVRKRGNLISFLRKRYSLVFGLNLEGEECDILYMLRPSNLVSNHARKHIEGLYRDTRVQGMLDDFEIDPRKWAPNNVVGQMGKDTSSVSRGLVCKDINEAWTFKEEQGGGIRTLVDAGIRVENEDGSFVGGDVAENLYLHFTTKMYRLKDGFLPIYHYIVETGVKKVFELKRDLESCGYVVYSAHTDCLTTDTCEEKEALFRERFADKYFGSEDGFESIGTLKVEHRETMTVKKVGSVEENSLLVPCVEKVEVERIEIKDEWDLNEIHSVMESSGKLAVEALYGGCGKTYSIQTWDKKKLFVVPTNRRRSTLMREGHDAVTVDTLLGYRMSREDHVFVQGKGGRFGMRGEQKTADDYDVIVWEEALMNPVDKLWAIKTFIDFYGSKKHLFTYDHRQNKPVGERTNNIVNVNEYRLGLVRSIAGKYIFLEKNKRNKSLEDERHYSALNSLVDRGNKSEMIRYLLQHGRVVGSLDQVENKFICYRNDMARSVAGLIHRRLTGGDDWFLMGQALLYKSKASVIPGVKFLFFKNDTYSIIGLDGDNVVLRHVLGEEVKLTRNQIKKHFILPYAETCHAVQGDTIDGKYTIDLTDTCIYDCEWLNTACGRGTSWDNISFYWSPVVAKHREVELRMMIQDMIQGHVAADFKAGRFISSETDYIDVDWVMQNLGSTCFLCGEGYDTEGQGCFSIDRIDNSIAHIKTNCRIICRNCNSIKR